MSRFQLFSTMSLLTFLSLGSTSTAIPAQESAALSARNANYTIEVRLDPGQKTFEAREVATWRNDQITPAGELWFHTYWNAWKNNKSTYLRESRLRGFNRQVREGDWSYCDVKSMRVLPSGPFAAADITSKLRYASPDDLNPDDQTVLVAALPQPVNPKDTIQVEIVWKSKIPRTFSRTGFRGNYFFIAQWFPKIGVYQADGAWNCHQFHAATGVFLRLRDL